MCLKQFLSTHGCGKLTKACVSQLHIFFPISFLFQIINRILVRCNFSDIKPLKFKYF